MKISCEIYIYIQIYAKLTFRAAPLSLNIFHHDFHNIVDLLTNLERIVDQLHGFQNGQGSVWCKL